MIENWKTSLAGIVAIISTVIAYWFPQYQIQWASFIALVTGLGLLAGADAKGKKKE